MWPACLATGTDRQVVSHGRGSSSSSSPGKMFYYYLLVFLFTEDAARQGNARGDGANDSDHDRTLFITCSSSLSRCAYHNAHIGSRSFAALLLHPSPRLTTCPVSQPAAIQHVTVINISLEINLRAELQMRNAKRVAHKQKAVSTFNIFQ